MSSLNRVTILGRVGKDPEVRPTASGKAVASFTVATSFGRGENERTDWHNCVAWEKSAEVIGRYVKKGDLIYIEGPLSTRKWTDKDGNDRYTTEIRVLGFTLIGRTVKREESDEEAPPARKPAAAPQGGLDGLDDDIPF